jgi:hypothetical protein
MPICQRGKSEGIREGPQWISVASPTPCKETQGREHGPKYKLNHVSSESTSAFLLILPHGIHRPRHRWPPARGILHRRYGRPACPSCQDTVNDRRYDIVASTDTRNILILEKDIRGGFQSSVLGRLESETLIKSNRDDCTFFFFFFHFGSHCTYPRLTPLISLTMSSNPSKSRAVTASNPTSKRMRDHSRKAYLV